ncbi:fumarate hydratase [Pyrococcus abyssi]|uniref:Fumarate hydratase n=1 Tax=Pyrococcus abyssi (strain GE5 / Orsay) TaxID=272844 RepID=Q9V1D9_PYRAB|nr:fumarate hydratase [Pyrococcus abyssi]CAB49410.1 ttdA fumarate hydratase class I, N-terminal domain [Pyrococcus abyssi GE5]CCE69875.1 TPA: fumarate hydratase [Pyrococcus abyssi GE5]
MREHIVEAIRMAVTRIPDDVVEAIKDALRREESEVAKFNLNMILKAIEIGKREGIPVCQDTGTPIFFVKTREINEVYEEIVEGVRMATERVPLRPNALRVIDGKVVGNVPEVHFEPGDETKISILMKGGGSENCTALFTLTPGEGLEGLKRKVIEHVKSCGGKPCPPIIVGIGIASPAEKALILAKKALLRKIGERNENEKLAMFEEELLEEINSLGIGPMGLGGKTTALDVKVEVETRHPASYIAGVAIQCWAHRRVFLEVKGGRVRIWQ